MKHQVLLTSLLFLSGCCSLPFGGACGSCDLGMEECCQSGQACRDSGCPQDHLSGVYTCLAPGCLATDKWKTKCAAKSLAHKHLPPGSCSDFKDGFNQAFVDVAMGACGDVPAIAPKKYWKYCGRTVDGHTKAQAWFEGYRTGAQIAVTYNDRFLDIATSQHCGQYQQVGFESGFQPY